MRTTLLYRAVLRRAALSNALLFSFPLLCVTLVGRFEFLQVTFYCISHLYALHHVALKLLCNHMPIDCNRFAMTIQSFRNRFEIALQLLKIHSPLYNRFVINTNNPNSPPILLHSSISSLQAMKTAQSCLVSST
jgi:hypothetical protein